MNRIINYIRTSFKIILLDLKKLKEYRLELVSNFLTFPIKMAIYCGLWYIILLNNPNSNISFGWIIGYFVNVSIIDFLITPFSVITYELMEDVKTGNLDMFLIKPYPYLAIKFFSNFKTILVSAPFLFIGIMINFKKISFKTFLFIVIMLLTVVLVVYLLFALVGIMSFYVDNVLSLRDNVWNIIRLFSGSIIPLSMYPSWLNKITEILPFRFIYFSPIDSILSGEISFANIVSPILWVIILFIIVLFIWRISLKKYSSQGG